VAASPARSAVAATTAAATASTAPTAGSAAQPQGFTLPSECRYVAGATAPQTWLAQCPQGLLSQALSASLTQQGWTPCASTPKSWRKDQLAIVITDFVNRTDATGQIEQKPLNAVAC